MTVSNHGREVGDEAYDVVPAEAVEPAQAVHQLLDAVLGMGVERCLLKLDDRRLSGCAGGGGREGSEQEERPRRGI